MIGAGLSDDDDEEEDDEDDEDINNQNFNKMNMEDERFSSDDEGFNIEKIQKNTDDKMYIEVS